MARAQATRVASHGIPLPLFRIPIPEQCAFPDLLEELLERSFQLEARQRAVRHKTQIARRETCTLLIEGLYYAYSCLVPGTAVALAQSPKYYKRGQLNKIDRYTHSNVVACCKALESLGWVTICMGFVRADGESFPTTMAPDGGLLKRFRATRPQWQRVSTEVDPLVIRQKDPHTRAREQVKPPDTEQAHQIRSQVLQINEFLSDQAIALNLPNDDLIRLAYRMASSRYSYDTGSGSTRSRARALNFRSVLLRRIFAKGRLDRGGRLYGGWWQVIPKDMRRLITINGRATVEVDFAEMHPTMLYLLEGQEPPKQIYDISLPGDPPFDPQAELFQARRKTVKQFLNALINDESGVHRLSIAASKRLGLSHEQLKQILLDKHPPLAKALGTDKGLFLQYLDSEIAVRVLLRLKEQAIVGLPMHDSILVQAEFERELIDAMQEAFSVVMGGVANLKATEMPQDGFERLGKRGIPALISAHLESFHDHYLRSWRQQHPDPTHPNLSFHAPFRFPDGAL